MPKSVLKCWKGLRPEPARIYGTSVLPANGLLEASKGRTDIVADIDIDIDIDTGIEPPQKCRRYMAKLAQNGL